MPIAGGGRIGEARPRQCPVAAPSANPRSSDPSGRPGHPQCTEVERDAGHEARGGRDPRLGRRPREGLLREPRVEARRHAARRGPAHAARLRMLGPVRREPHDGRARFGSAQLPGRRRPRGDPGRAASRRRRAGRVLAHRPGGPGQRPGSRAPQLLLARRPHRPRRQHVVAAGDHDAAARPDRRRRRNDLLVHRRPRRARCGARRPRTASTRSAPGSATRTGPPGTRST